MWLSGNSPRSFDKKESNARNYFPGLILILFLILIIQAQSQNTTKVTLGPGYEAYFHYNINNHAADFQKLPDVPNCCPQFKSGSGSDLPSGVYFINLVTPTAKKTQKLEINK